MASLISIGNELRRTSVPTNFSSYLAVADESGIRIRKERPASWGTILKKRIPFSSILTNLALIVTMFEIPSAVLASVEGARGANWNGRGVICRLISF
jgi:hypothetical protein